MSGLPDIGLQVRKSAKADLRRLAAPRLAPQGDGLRAAQRFFVAL